MSTNKDILWIPTSKVSHLIDKFNQLGKKAYKNNLTPPKLELTDERTTKTYEITIAGHVGGPFAYKPKRYEVPLRKVEIEGEMPVINGWKFLASIQHSDQNNHHSVNMVNTALFNTDFEKKLIENEKDEFEKCPPNCEHCDLSRKRNQKFILMNNETLETKQVGSTCVDDFLGENSLKKALIMYELDELLTRDYVYEYVEAHYTGKTQKSSYLVPIEIFVAQASMLIDTEGFVSKQNAESETPATVRHVLEAFRNPNEAQKRLFDAFDRGVSHKQLDKARDAMDFYKSIDSYGKSFIQNIQNIVTRGYVDLNIGFQTGISTYIPEGYNRELERLKQIEIEKANTLDEFYGEVKQRGTLKLTLSNVREYTNVQYPYVKFTFKDDDKRTFVWQASYDNFPDLEEGLTYQLKGTIKSHYEGKAGKVTYLNRCANIEEVAIDSEPPVFIEEKGGRKKVKKELDSPDLSM